MFCDMSNKNRNQKTYSWNSEEYLKYSSVQYEWAQELIPKDMIQKGKEGLAGWIRTTWLPYTERIPENMRNNFINELINSYNNRFPIDDNGLFHIKMVRLEVEAVNPIG